MYYNPLMILVEGSVERAAYEHGIKSVGYRKNRQYLQQIVRRSAQYEKNAPIQVRGLMKIITGRPNKNKISRERYHEIVYLREVRRLTLKETGDRMGLTRERIRQVTYKEPSDTSLPIYI